MDLGSFDDLLGAVVGFATVMLMLSLVVTGLVQSVAQMLRVRARVTRAVLAQFLREELRLEPAMVEHVTGTTVGSFEERQLRAKRGMPAAEARASGSQAATGIAAWGKKLGQLLSDRPARDVWIRRVFGQGRAELAWNELRDELRRANAEADMARAEAEFGRLKAQISDRYASTMRVWSILFGFFLAAAFQVSATKLLGDLSTDEELRAQALALAASLEERGPPAATTFRILAAEAVGELARKHPGLAAALEEMSFISDTRDELLGELRSVLEDEPDRDAYVAECAEIVQRLESQQRTERQQLASLSREGLAKLDIRLASDLCFYLECAKPGAPEGSRRLLLGNLVGVLVTGFLLTFGAPFWYEQLRRLRVFQNSLRTSISDEEQRKRQLDAQRQAPDLIALASKLEPLTKAEASNDTVAVEPQRRKDLP